MRASFAIRVAIAMFLAFMVGTPAVLAACCTCATSADPNAKICITPTAAGSCGNLAQISSNPNVKALVNCKEDAICKTVANGGTCSAGPIAESAYGASTSGGGDPAGTPAGPIVQLTVPDLNIKIPGLIFANSVVRSQGYVEIPFFAQYVAAVYKFLIVISAIAASIMIVYGGFLYIVASSGAKVKQGKTIIIDAVIGLILVLGAYVILSTVNPNLLNLNAIKLQVVKPVDPYNDYLGNGPQAGDEMAFVGIQPGKNNHSVPPPESDTEYSPPPSTAAFPTNLTIPKQCPGRDPSYKNPKGPTGYNIGLPDSVLSVQLDEETIRAYLAEQSRTGVPMGVIIGQILTETGSTATSKCIVQNLFKDPSKCGSADYFKYFNFGGIACAPSQVPAGVCAHAAFTPGFDPMNKGKQYGTSCDAPDGPNTTFNKYSNVCLTPCRTTDLKSYASTVDCGEKCYPQISHAAASVDGTMVWYPSLQCSRKFKNAREFLDDHLGFARFCLPYNDSPYKFAYCIGASGYGGAGLKPSVLAQIIERNCLCGSNDSTGCKRDTELEKNLATHIWKEATLVKYAHTCTKFDAQKKCIDTEYWKSGPDYPAIIQALKDATHGALDAHEFPQAQGAIQVGQ